MGKKWIEQKIKLDCVAPNGGSEEKECDAICNNGLAIHKGVFASHQWCITHILSDRSVIRYIPSLVKAKRILSDLLVLNWQIDRDALIENEEYIGLVIRLKSEYKLYS